MSNDPSASAGQSASADPAPRRAAATFRAMGRALRHRNYRLFFFGQAISLVGTWVTKVAQSWLVFRLTGSPWLLGVVGFAGQLPTSAFSPLAGVLIDRWDRHRALLATQILSLVQSALLCLVTVTGRVNVWVLLVLAAMQGVINAFDTPARQAFVIEMVESREDLPNAIALNSTLVNSARLVGPSIAGLLIATVGEGWCFAADALSYVAVIASLVAMTNLVKAPSKVQPPMSQALREGWQYVVSYKPIRALLLLLALLSFCSVPYMTLMPIVATHVLGGGPHTLGLLMGASGVGAVAGALWMAQRPSVLGLGRVIGVTALCFAVGLCAFSWSTTLPVSMACLAFTGGGMMVSFAAANTMIQTLSDEDKRGRVMSFYTLAFFGVMPFGSLLAGALGDRLGAPHTILCSGVVALVGVAIFARTLPKLRPFIRPVYERLGILPAVATGLQHAAERALANNE